VTSIGVVIPAYCQAKYIRERALSVAKQTRRPDQIVFVDDCSTDGTVNCFNDAAREFGLNVELRLNRQRNGFPCMQWRTGVHALATEYVWIAEGDDSAEPSFLEELAALLAADSSIGFATAGSVNIDSKGRTSDSLHCYLSSIDSFHWRMPYVNHGQSELRDFIINRNTVPNVSACLFRRTALVFALEIEINLALCGDWLVYGRILSRWNIGYTSRKLNRFRTHSCSVRQTFQSKLRRIEESYHCQAELAKLVVLDAIQWERAARYTFREFHHLVAHLPKADWERSVPRALLDVGTDFDRELTRRLHSPGRSLGACFRTASPYVAGFGLRNRFIALPILRRSEVSIVGEWVLPRWRLDSFDGTFFQTIGVNDLGFGSAYPASSWPVNKWFRPPASSSGRSFTVSFGVEDGRQS
jgi:glycosyltransferase involved in cell wall biosynthesis